MQGLVFTGLQRLLWTRLRNLDEFQALWFSLSFHRWQIHHYVLTPVSGQLLVCSWRTIGLGALMISGGIGNKFALDFSLEMYKCNVARRFLEKSLPFLGCISQKPPDWSSCLWSHLLPTPLPHYHQRDHFILSPKPFTSLPLTWGEVHKALHDLAPTHLFNIISYLLRLFFSDYCSYLDIHSQAPQGPNTLYPAPFFMEYSLWLLYRIFLWIFIGTSSSSATSSGLSSLEITFTPPHSYLRLG